MNISLTSTCCRVCPFCFARDAAETLEPNSPHMPLERVESVLDFLVRSQIPEARFLGGEPTMHPDFDHIVDRVLARGLRLVLFSGGIMPETALSKIESLDASVLAVLLNVVPPGAGTADETGRQEDALRRLGRRVTLGTVIDAPGADLEFLLELIERYNLARTIRIGLAHPTLGGSNRYLRRRHYPEVGRRAIEFSRHAEEHGVRLDFDCGWVPCMFPEGTLAELGASAVGIGLRCGPILDVLPDGRVISCYPLAAAGAEALPVDRDAAWLRTRFSKQLEAARRLTSECADDSCSWREHDECTGGCLASSLGRQRRREFSVAVPEPA